MNQQFKTLRNYAYILLGAVALYACGEDGPKPKPDPKPKTEEPVKPSEPETPTTEEEKIDIPVVSTDNAVDEFPGINTTEVRKIVLRMYEGHLHGVSYHYVAGPKGFNHNGFSYEQEMELEFHGDHWHITKGENLFLFMKGEIYGGNNLTRPVGGNLPKTGEEIPAPVYGLWVEYYDANGTLLNDEFARNGAYQTFFRPMQAKTISNGEALTKTADDLLGYIYRDTNPHHLAAKNGAKFNDDVNPVGLKGFFFFNEANTRFALNIELWETPKGKLTDGKRAVFYEPSEYIKKTGKPVLTVSIPTYVYMSQKKLEDMDYDLSFDDLSQEEQSVFTKVMGLLETTWDKVLKDFMLRIDGKRAGEETGQWF